MNDREVEAKQERKGKEGGFIPLHIQSQCYHRDSEEKESCRDES